jgi:hypothetical protein
MTAFVRNIVALMVKVLAMISSGIKPSDLVIWYLFESPKELGGLRQCLTSGRCLCEPTRHDWAKPAR